MQIRPANIVDEVLEGSDGHASHGRPRQVEGKVSFGGASYDIRATSSGEKVEVVIGSGMDREKSRALAAAALSELGDEFFMKGYKVSKVSYSGNVSIGFQKMEPVLIASVFSVLRK